VAFGILYKAASTLGRKRKKRGLDGDLGDLEQEEEEGSSLAFKFQDFLWHGKRARCCRAFVNPLIFGRLCRDVFVNCFSTIKV
jgi:hypothetical protein